MCTVARGEITAYMHHLIDLGPHGLYVGDCSMVVRHARNGVPIQARSSSNINADLWREVHRLQLDRGATASAARKTKAHRSRTAAEADEEDPIELWEGNKMADQQAKDLASRSALNSMEHHALLKSRGEAIEPITRASLAVAWNLKLWPNLGQTKVKKRRRITRGGGEDTNGHLLTNRESNAWECVRCRLWARGQQGRRTLLRYPCRGQLDTAAHETHDIAQNDGIIWCRRCGSYSSRLLRGLLRPCAGAPGSEAQRNVRRRLQAGLAPTTADYLTAERTVRRQRYYDDGDIRNLSIGGDGIGTGGIAMEEITARRARRRERHEHAALGWPAGTYQGVYLRLPGGPLWHGQSGTDGRDGTRPHAASPTSGVASSTNVSADLIPAAANVYTTEAASSTDGASAGATVSGRRRLRQKTNVGIPASSTTASPRSSPARRDAICSPTATDSWTRRIAMAPGGGLAAAAKCTLCQILCRTTCKGCHSHVCASCARVRRPCSATSPIV